MASGKRRMWRDGITMFMMVVSSEEKLIGLNSHVGSYGVLCRYVGHTKCD